MRRILIGVTVAVTVATIIGPVWAQAPSPTAPPQWPWLQAAYAGTSQPYPFPAVTPSDAYRQGLINRWELERFEGPTPQALQGPSPDGTRNGGGDSRGGR
jgi:hypothetical protein